MHEHFLRVLVSVSGTNDALQQNVAKAKSTTHANWGCLTRPFMSILSVHLRQEYFIVCHGRSSDLSRLLRLPNNEVSG